MQSDSDLPTKEKRQELTTDNSKPSAHNRTRTDTTSETNRGLGWWGYREI
jgi:hypothetical protein